MIMKIPQIPHYDEQKKQNGLLPRLISLVCKAAPCRVPACAFYLVST